MNGAVPLLAVGGAQTDGCLKRNLCRLSYSSTFEVLAPFAAAWFWCN